MPLSVLVVRRLLHSDPVMGGQSSGTWSVNATGAFGVMDGEVLDVPSLSAPGFIKAAADGSFADISPAFGGDLVLTVRSTTPEYDGFRVSFAAGASSASYACGGGGSLPFSRGCFKAPFVVPKGDKFVAVRIPFASFSDLWSPATGEQTTTCADDVDACVTADKLAKIQRLEVWAEGADGLVHIEVLSISAEPAAVAAADSPPRPPADSDVCADAAQQSLLYNISSRTTAPGMSVASVADEPLVEAVCCDSRAAMSAEPMFTFAAPDINLFGVLDPTDGVVTTFYDSVCGLPLFRAPVNRSFAEFEEETMEHGWPSFRTAEVIFENVVTDEATGRAFSSCGTQIGSYLPDEAGARWCIDLSCVAGNPV